MVDVLLSLVTAPTVVVNDAILKQESLSRFTQPFFSPLYCNASYPIQTDGWQGYIMRNYTNPAIIHTEVKDR